ncbi:barstar family protein [Sorangium sp. So ce1153]|uniref:barstar family protein n=1 Tax=Sorangium sp. So ce1153 TaxID=3133333 RepID=UPI003F61A776
MLAEIDGRRITSEMDFHREISLALDFGPYYGNNLDALWDRLSTDVERPVTLIWNHSTDSKEHLGDIFDKIVHILYRAQKQDEELGWTERFQFELR